MGTQRFNNDMSGAAARTGNLIKRKKIKIYKMQNVRCNKDYTKK